MAAGVIIKHKRKAGPFLDGDLAIGEFGLDTVNDVWYYSNDDVTVTTIAAPPGDGVTQAEAIAYAVALG